MINMFAVGVSFAGCRSTQGQHDHGDSKCRAPNQPVIVIERGGAGF